MGGQAVRFLFACFMVAVQETNRLPIGDLSKTGSFSLLDLAMSSFWLRVGSLIGRSVFVLHPDITFLGNDPK